MHPTDRAGQVRGRRWVLTTLTILMAISTAASAQIDVNETDLHDGAIVYGFYAPGTPIPYVNLETINLWAWGAGDPNYPNASFYAYGLYAGINLINSGPIDVSAVGGTATVVGGALLEAYGIKGTGSIDNSGDLTVTATGGTGVFDPFILANNFANTGPDTRVYGISTSGNVHNDGTITVTATGGPGTMEEVGDPDNIGYASLFARTDAQGISAGDVDNTGAITAIASGATLVLASTGKTTAYASEDSSAIGILAEGDATNSGDIVAIATGGNVTATAETYAYAYADPEAYGIIVTGNLVNSGAITTEAIAGTSSSNHHAFASSFAIGIWGETDQDPAPTADNSGAIDVTSTGGDTTATKEAAATAGAWGMKFTGDMTNSAAITTTATGGSAAAADRAWADGYAFGLYAYPPGDGDVDADVVNSGAIDVLATGGTADSDDIASSYAEVQGIVGNGDVTNEGDVRATARAGTADGGQTVDAYATVRGISTYRGDVANSGAIDVNATGGTAVTHGDSAIAQARALTEAVYAYKNIDNFGLVTASATGGTAIAELGDAHAYGTAYGLHSRTGDILNTGNVAITAMGGTATGKDLASADANAYAYGIDAYGTASNAGDLSVTATGGTVNVNRAANVYSNALAYGIDSNDAVANIGGLTVTAMGGITDANCVLAVYSGATAYGIASDATVNTTGSLIVAATGGTVDGNEVGVVFAGADAYGISTEGGVNNTGTIAVTATGGTTEGSASTEAAVNAYGIASAGAVDNTGPITVTAAGPTAGGLDVIDEEVFACGIAGASVENSGAVTVTATTEAGSRTYAVGIDMYGDGTLTNTGIVRAFADTAYELRAGYGTTTLVGTYNVTLDGDPQNASIYVADHATLVLNNATLTVTEVAGETLWDTPYRLFEVDPDGAVTGRFGAVQAVNPDATAVYYTQGTANAADDRVALTYDPQASEAAQAATVEKHLISQPIDLVQRHMTGALLHDVLHPGASGLLADAGPAERSMILGQAESHADNGVFVEPYYSRLRHDANPLGYRANLSGFAAGYERRIDSTLIALHMGYGRANINYTGVGYSANREDQDVLTGGLSGLTLWHDWTFRYGLTGVYGSHDYKGLTGLSLTETEKGSTNSYGAAASALVGRLLRRGSHALLPEAGLNYLWSHRQRYTTDASDPAWDTTYSSLDDHDLQAEAALHWLCGFTCKDVHVAPLASIGVRHLLTDGETSIQQSVPGTTPVSIPSERDRTAMTLAGSVALTKASHTLSLAYDGEYSPDARRHSLWLRFGWQF